MKKYIFPLFYLISALFLLVACEEEPVGLGEEKDKAKIIFVNATPNASAVPALANREIGIYPFYNGVQFNNHPIKFPWSNGYKAFVPGTMTIRLDTARSIGNDPPGPAANVREFSFPTQADNYYSVYSVGTTEAVDHVVLNDNLTLPSAGKAKVRIMNFSPDAGALDVVITNNNQTLAANLAYKGVQEFIEIDPGTYNIQFRAAGTTTVVASRNGLIIDPASCYSIWTRGAVAATRTDQRIGVSYHANRWTNPLK